VTLMTAQILSQCLLYAMYVFEVVVCVLLASRGGWRRLKALSSYVALLLGLDGLARPAVLHYYGQASVQYGYFYWLTDVALALGAFLLICSFFRRACRQEQKIWTVVRLLLIFVPIMVLGISCLSITRHYSHLWSFFITEFSQYLYFSCLVLNTMLYVMIQQLAIDDEELGLLVCGLGVQFAGEAALLALFNLTFNDDFTRLVFSFLSQICTLGMLLTWTYAILKTPKTVPVGSRLGRQPALAEAVAD